MIEQLTIYTTRIPKVRLGGPCDGGYAVNLESLCKSSALFTYGVSNDISFEIDYVKATGKKVFCFDHTCNPVYVPPGFEKNITHFLEGVSGEKQEKTDTFFAHYDKYFEKHFNDHENSFGNKVLLKIDIEGNEYETFSKMDIEKLSEIAAGLIIEFHFLASPEHRAMFFDLLTRINKYFYLTHLHGNNFLGNFDFFEKRFASDINEWYIEKFSIPRLLELSFLNKEMTSYIELDTREYPLQETLDAPNMPLRIKDANVDFLQKI